MPKLLKIAATFVGVTLLFGLPTSLPFLGVQLLGLLLAPSEPKAPKSSRERQQAIREGAAVRVMSFGTVKVGADSHPIYDTNSDNEFMRLLALNHGSIDSFVTHFLNSEAVTLDGSNLVNNSVDGKWDGNVEIVTFLGADAQTALAEPVADYAPWTTDHRMRGVAGVYIKQTPVKASSERARHLHQELHYNAVLRAADDIFDPRDLTTAYSDNAALVLLWYLTHPDGRNRTLADVDEPSFKVAADTCDEAVPLKGGGSEKRYRASGSVSLAEDPNDVLRDMLANMDAILFFNSAGKITVQISDIALTADLTFTQNHILTSDFQAGPRALERYNRVVAAMVSEDHNYQDITSPAFEDAVDVAANGAKTFLLQLRFCPSHTQAQRLSKKKLRRLNPAEQGTLTLNMAGLFARHGATVKLGYPNAETNLDMRVGSREISSSGIGVTLEVATIASDYDAWDETTEEKDLAALPTASGSDAILAAPTGVTATNVGLALNSSTPGVAIKVTWTSPADSAIDAQIEVQVDGSGVWFDRQTVEANQGEATTHPLDDEVVYDARVRFIGPSGGITDWVIVENVTTASELSIVGSVAGNVNSTAGTVFAMGSMDVGVSNTGKKCILAITTEDESPHLITAVSIGGVALTERVTKQQQNAKWLNGAIWAGDISSISGSQAISVTMAGVTDSVAVSGVSVHDMVSLTPTDTATDSEMSGTTSNLSNLSSQPGGIVIADGVSLDRLSSASWSSMTEKADLETGGGAGDHRHTSAWDLGSRSSADETITWGTTSETVAVAASFR